MQKERYYFSIIIPFYKGNRMINDTIKSVCQSADAILPIKKYEIIIVNDSPEVPVKLMDNLLKDKVIRLINNVTNMGIHASRIRGLKDARGEYILFLDQDDYIYPNFFPEMYRKMKRSPVCDCVIGNAICEEKNGSEHWFKYGFSSSMLLRRFFYVYDGNQILSPGQTLIKKTAIPDAWIHNIMQVNGSDDYLLWLMMLFSGRKFTFINSIVYRHHYTGENVSGNLQQMRKSDYLVCKILYTNHYLSKNQYIKLKNRIDFKEKFKSLRISKIRKIQLSFCNWKCIFAYLISKNLKYRGKIQWE